MARAARSKTPKRRNPRDARRAAPKKPCQLCNTTIDWKDAALLRKYVSDRGKIRTSRVTGNCRSCQRKVAIAVKNGREMALLPYVSK